MSTSVSTLNQNPNADRQWQAFVVTKAIIEPATMDAQSTGSDEPILATVTRNCWTTSTDGSLSKADFVLVAQTEQWENLLSKDPVAPYPSFVGLQVGIS